MDCIIIGGGAAGLSAACALTAAGADTAIVERLDRVGKKLLSTGNGRCNLSNTAMSAECYGSAAPFVRRVFDVTPPAEVMRFWDALGLMTACEDGRIYPRTMAASSVLDALRAGCGRAQLLAPAQAIALRSSRRGGMTVRLADGQTLSAPAVLAAMGGSAAPHLGTDGAGTQLLRELGHSVTQLYPALVQLRCEHPALRALKGLRTQATLTLEIDGHEAAQETGELLFADYGVSGVCVFQLSGMAAQALGEGLRVRLLVNLLPDVPADALPGWLDARIDRFPDRGAQALMTGVLPRLLAQSVLRQAQLAPDAPASSLSRRERSALLDALRAFPLAVTGTQGLRSAQVTRGGVLLDEVEPGTMRSRLFDGLYIAGESLDVDGPCGGYNLHFAVASGLTAARAIRAQLEKGQ